MLALYRVLQKTVPSNLRGTKIEKREQKEVMSMLSALRDIVKAPKEGILDFGSGKTISEVRIALCRRPRYHKHP